MNKFCEYCKKLFSRNKAKENAPGRMLNTLLPRYIEKDKPSYHSVKELGDVLGVSEKENICNIALTGPYGCGKSSVLKTLQRDFSKKRTYLTISLATLRSDYDEEQECDAKDANSEETKGSVSLKDIRSRKIEYSIFQQLVYREKASDVPHSRFKRIRHFTGFGLWGLTLGIIVFIVCLCFVIKPISQRIEGICDIKCSSLLSILMGGYVVLCVTLTIRYLIRILGNLKVDKLNLKLGEIDIQGNASIFNKHLDEILYFFRVTKYNVVLFEDLDRFDSPDIYLKLRELNFLINQSKEIKRHIVFVYAVKDDMFKDECRTKFFDYIISIIPVINSSNSKDILKLVLEESGFPKGGISDDNLSGIAFFIKDMRSLINIVNEFGQYRERLRGKSLYMYKLLAIIAYKNYYPDEFADLHSRQGRICKCISLKDAFIEIALQSIQAEEAALREEEKERQESEHAHASELRFVFLCRLGHHTSSYGYTDIHIDGQYRSLYDIAKDELLFDSLLKVTTIDVQYGRGNRTQINVGVAKFYEEWGYKQRVEIISEKSKQDYISRKRLLDQKRLKITGLTLSQLLKQYKSVRESKLYKSLQLEDMEDVFLKDGFIDEDYYDYISYAYPGMLSLSDRDYLLGIKMLKEPDYTHKIDEKSNFIKELQPNNFEHDSILNVELLDYLLENKEKQTRIADYASRFLALITQEPFRYDFLWAFYSKSKKPKAFFVPFLIDKKDTFWRGVFAIEDDDQKGDLIECVLRYCGTFSDDMLKWLTDNFAFLRTHENIESECIQEIVKDLKFNKINTSRLSRLEKIRLNKFEEEPIDSLLDSVVANNAYVINSDNLAVVLNHLYHSDEWNSRTLRFDAILRCPADDTIAYLTAEENLAQTVSCILIDLDNDESLETVEFIVKSGLPEETKINFLKGQLEQRPNVEGLREEDARILYECDLVKPTWDNVEVLYEMLENKEDEILTKFIKHNNQPLSAPDSASGISNEVKIFDLLFGNNEVLSLSEYKRLIDAFLCFCYGNEYLATLEAERFAVLLDTDRIPFNSSNIKVINSTEHLLPFLIHHSRAFVEHLDWNYNLTTMMVLTLLLNDRFTSADKAKIVTKAGKTMIVDDTRLATQAAMVIAENLPEIDLAQDDVFSIMEKSDAGKSNLKIAIWLLEKSELSQERFVKILKGLKDEIYCQLADQEEGLRFNNDLLDRQLIDILKDKGFIATIEENGNSLILHFGRQEKM